jgi:hypothetical protein
VRVVLLSLNLKAARCLLRKDAGGEEPSSPSYYTGTYISPVEAGKTRTSIDNTQT